MQLREITVADVPAILEVRVSTRENAFSREALHAAGITEETVVAMLGRDHRGWLCETADGGRAVRGFAMGDGSSGELWVLAVRPEDEGQGIGGRLLEATQDWLWSLGWKKLWLWTSPDTGLRAYGFYRRHGWIDARIEGSKRIMTLMKPPGVG